MLAITSAIAYALSADTGLAIRRTAGSTSQEQAREITSAAEAVAVSVLREPLEDPSASIHPAQVWAQPYGPIELIPGYVMEARLVDLQGRFNLNSLVKADGLPNEPARRVFERLLLGLEIEPLWAARVTDWIDGDDQPLEGGAEVSYYSGLSPARRPANRPLTSPSELLALEGFGIELYRRLEPHVTALPRDAGLNLCSASGPLLDALTGERQWTEAEQALQSNRQSDCFPRLDVLRNSLPNPSEFEALRTSLAIGEHSRYFGLFAYVSSGGSGYTSYSLLRHEGPGAGQFRVLLRHTAP